MGRLVARMGKLAAAAPGRVLDIAPLMGDLTMDVICSCVFGIEFNTQEGNDGAAMPQGMPYSGKELVWACRTIFDQVCAVVLDALPSCRIRASELGVQARLENASA